MIVNCLLDVKQILLTSYFQNVHCAIYPIHRGITVSSILTYVWSYGLPSLTTRRFHWMAQTNCCVFSGAHSPTASVVMSGNIFRALSRSISLDSESWMALPSLWTLFWESLWCHSHSLPLYIPSWFRNDTSSCQRCLVRSWIHRHLNHYLNWTLDWTDNLLPNDLFVSIQQSHHHELWIDS